jgi:GT2 family glycosyltransferase
MDSGARKVSVIVVNYNGMPYIEVCLQSIFRQTYKDFEVIVVDNKSNDGSMEFVKQKFPKALVAANEANYGYAGGINVGMRYATGQYLAPINVDTEVDREWLSYLVHFLDANPQVGAVTPKGLLYRDRRKVGVLGLNIHITGVGFVSGFGKPDNEYAGEPFQVAGVSGFSFMLRREIVEKMGGLNEENFMYYDDVDLSWMINLMGYGIYCVPQSIVHHEYELEMSPQKMFFLEYGRWNALLCYLRPATFIALIPALSVTEVLIGIYCTIRGPRYMWAKMIAWDALLRNLRRLLRRRTRVQKLRKMGDFQLLRRFKLNYDWMQLSRILR